MVALVSVHGVHPYEWWFGTMPDWQVWTILIALGPGGLPRRCACSAYSPDAGCASPAPPR